MRESSTNICPLLAIAGSDSAAGSAACVEKCCAWWRTDYDPKVGTYGGACALMHIADALKSIDRYGIN